MIAYTIRRTTTLPALVEGWEHPGWSNAETAEVSSFRPEGSDHQPRTRVRLLQDGETLAVLFRVDDRFVRCTHTERQSPVCRDSCVEVFLRPASAGYFNFEVNCGGALLCYHIRDWRRTGTGFADYTVLTAEELRGIEVQTSMPRVVEPEITEATTWTASLRIPLEFLRDRSSDPPHGRAEWTGNFYKCGDETSHPHWASWSPVRALNFHDPDCFGRILLAD